jgi:hypothetical protein
MPRLPIRLYGLIICLVLLVASNSIHAQAPIGPFDVFLSRSADKAESNIIFLNIRTGLSNTIATNGTGYTLINNRVLYHDNAAKAAKVVYPDGRAEVFTTIEMPDPNSSVKWVISTNRQWIAWSVSVLRDQSLIADLFIAKVDGSNRKLVLHTSSTKGVDTVPLSIVDNGAMIFYSRQEQQPQPYQLFPVAADVFRLDIASGQSTELSGKTDCLCAIGFAPDGQIFTRLEAVGGNLSFNAHVWDMSINKDFVIAAPKLSHRQAGYILVSRNGNLIVYTSARGVPPAKGVPRTLCYCSD